MNVFDGKKINLNEGDEFEVDAHIQKLCNIKVGTLMVIGSKSCAKCVFRNSHKITICFNLGCEKGTAFVECV